MGITPCSDHDHVDIDDSSHPAWVLHSFSFDCLSFNGAVYYDVYATLDITGRFQINFTSFDFFEHVDLDEMMVRIDEMEGVLRTSLRSFTDDGSNLT